jgi:hypothetical protein
MSDKDRVVDALIEFAEELAELVDTEKPGTLLEAASTKVTLEEDG